MTTERKGGEGGREEVLKTLRTEGRQGGLRMGTERNGGRKGGRRK